MAGLCESDGRGQPSKTRSDKKDIQAHVARGLGDIGQGALQRLRKLEAITGVGWRLFSFQLSEEMIMLCRFRLPIH